MHTGSCLCGGIRFQISGDLPPIIVCYCSQCRKAQGGPAGTNIPIPEAAFLLSDPEHLLQSYESSPGKRRCFCRRCGSPVLARRDAVPGVVRVRAGLITESISPGVAGHMHVASKCNWWPINDDLPQFPQAYVPPPTAG